MSKATLGRRLALVGATLMSIASMGAAALSEPVSIVVSSVRAEPEPRPATVIEREPVVLRAPAASYEPRRVTAVSPLPGEIVRLQAYHFDSLVYFRPNSRSHTAGVVRRGVEIPVIGPAAGETSGCEGGTWFDLGVGFACTSLGFLATTEPALAHDQRLPDLSRPLPYSYAQVTTDGAPRFYRLPTAAEEVALASADAPGAESVALPDVVDLRMKGDYFVAIDRFEDGEAGRYVRTVRGRYVRASDLTPLDPPKFVGQVLDGTEALPLAFVWVDRAELYRTIGDGLEVVGHAELHARFFARSLLRVGDEEYVVGAGGLAVRRTDVRIVTEIPRPVDIEPGQRWIHVSLGEQTLTAYDEHDVPIFATLVSSGKDGYDTPSGSYYVGAKHVTIMMSGDDPIDGHYEVEEVPWTMYYLDSYALHGAYWHDQFGRARSHGCTNLAPADARWLFSWTRPDVPSRFHARIGKGTRVIFTE